MCSAAWLDGENKFGMCDGLGKVFLLITGEDLSLVCVYTLPQKFCLTPAMYIITISFTVDS